MPAERIVRIGDNKGARYMSDNFWMMGDTGPCGPCSEIFYDHGPSVQGGPPGSPDEDGDRYIEIWNLVFMQFSRDEKGNMNKLPRPSIDTGMGLERIAAVLQGVHSNYEIDLFKNLLAAAKAAVESVSETPVDETSPSLKVIADHIRACAFCVADGVVPGNEGRAYVLRRICRRAIRHGYKLGARGPFFYKLVAAVEKEMGEAYPELRNPEIAKVIEAEERRFLTTLSKGMEILEDAIAKTTDSVLDGSVVFKLHDTYGFPADLTADVCRERGLTVDTDAFDRHMEEQRAAARANAKFKMFTLYLIRIEATDRMSGTERNQIDKVNQSINLISSRFATDIITCRFADAGADSLPNRSRFANNVTGNRRSNNGIVNIGNCLVIISFGHDIIGFRQIIIAARNCALSQKCRITVISELGIVKACLHLARGSLQSRGIQPLPAPVQLQHADFLLPALPQFCR